ncbi:MAG: MFS transporter [Rhodospirillaceae bacterium]|nr:MFS transporter [Rhodospirillaceae bacterium]MDE0618540.1 MFS transporter [Rhodospirillaceae bacterium]
MARTPPAALDVREQPYGWIMVAVTFLLSVLTFGGLPAVAVFIKPLTLEFGWTRGETSLGYTAIAVSAAVAGLGFGILADRFGTRAIAAVAVVGMGAAYLLQSGQSTLTEYYLAHFLFGATGLAVVSGPMLIGIGYWFGRNKGLAIGIVACGGGVGQGLMPIVDHWLIESGGWRDALFSLGLIYLALGIPLALMVRDAPVRLAARRAAAGDADGALTRSQTGLPANEVIAWLSVAVFLCCTCMSVLIVHLVPLLTDRGVDASTAVQILSALMLAGAGGRLVGGTVADRLGVLPTYFAMSVGQTAVIYWFVVVDSMALIWLLAIMFGLFFAGVMVSFITCCREFIPPRIGGRGMAVVGLLGWGGMGFGSFIGGAGFDWTGDYRLAFALAVAAGVANLVVLVFFAGRIKGGGGMKLWLPHRAAA